MALVGDCETEYVRVWSRAIVRDNGKFVASFCVSICRWDTQQWLGEKAT